MFQQIDIFCMANKILVKLQQKLRKFKLLFIIKTFNGHNNAVKWHSVKFFTDERQKNFEHGILKLPERWRKVVEQNGKYEIDYSSF